MAPRRTFLITSGPTREYIDPVRYLSNASSGRMGAALADAALRKGHRVIVVSGPVDIPPVPGAEWVPVVSAREMFRAVKALLREADIVIGAAAVADYRPAARQRHKIKKDSGTLALELVKNPDILKYAGRHKGGKVVAGFALESRHLMKAAQAKLEDKDLDLIVANAPSAIGGSATSAWLLRRDGTVSGMKDVRKSELAERIIDETLGIAQGL